MEIVGINAARWTLPLRAPFKVAKRTAYEALNVLVTVTADDGTTGYGGAAPVGYVTGESVESVMTAIRTITPPYDGQPVERLTPLLEVAEGALASAPSARAAIEMALLDLWAKKWNIPLWQFFGAAQQELTTDLTIPIVDPGMAREMAREAWGRGFRHLKIKVGSPSGPEHDLASVAAIREGAPNAKLRIDANQGFTAEGALAFLGKVEGYAEAVELLEQPVHQDDFEGLGYVRSRCNVPVFADESAQSIGRVRKLIQQDVVDGINIKIMKSGIFGALRIANLCHVWGKKLMIGCMLESRLGQTASCFVAAGLGRFDFIDLDAHELLAPATGGGGFRAEKDRLLIESDAPGWGVSLGDEAPL